jgi:ERCC4-related helicase/ERCC4-type nuclease
MSVVHPLVREGALTLRRYQESTVARALDDSTLVVLPTGLGKTIIAAMVAAHRLSQCPQGRVLFLAPTKPLVLQHMQSFKEILNVPNMCVLTGAEPPKRRREMWDASRIIFATPQTIENDLVRGLPISDVCLIVFDEAHRAIGDYSYVSIAKEYRKAAPDPMTLGLTASPSSEEETVMEICRNLGIRHVEAKTELDADVKPYIQSVQVHWVRVELPEPFRQVQKLLQSVMRKDVGNLKELGYLQSADLSKVTKTVLLKMQARIRAEIVSGIEAYSAASAAASAIKVNHAIELLETQGIGALDEYFRRLKTQPSRAVKNLMRDNDLLKAMEDVSDMRKSGAEHPKLDELVKIVSKYRGRKVLVFTQYRDSVDTIIQKLNAADILAHEFIGQASKGVKAGMSQKRQVEVLEKFKDGAYTALVATSVAEEGLDIPKVDAVVFFEPVPSEIRTIQRRGRTGRSAAGEVYVLIAKGTRDEAYYWVSLHKERKMGAVVRELRRGLREQAELGAYEGGPEESAAPSVVEPAEATPEAASAQQSIASYGTEAGGRLKVFVDARERNSKILSALRERCDVELRQLPVGDYILSDRVCVERKTMEDFLQSIVDKRLMSQAHEMRRNFAIPIMILEKVDRLYAQRNIHPSAVRGVIASLAVDYNMPIIPSEDEEDTAQIIISLARREQEDNRRAVAMRGERKPELLHERQRFIVESLPAVSAVLADRLLRRFSSVEAVMSASPKELEEVEGIGQKKAQDIRGALGSAYVREVGEKHA